MSHGKSLWGYTAGSAHWSIWGRATSRPSCLAFGGKAFTCARWPNVTDAGIRCPPSPLYTFSLIRTLRIIRPTQVRIWDTTNTEHLLKYEYKVLSGKHVQTIPSLSPSLLSSWRSLLLALVHGGSGLLQN